MPNDVRVVRVVTAQSFFDMVIGDRFDLPSFWRAVKADGHFCNDVAFIPYHAIQCIVTTMISAAEAETRAAHAESAGAVKN